MRVRHKKISQTQQSNVNKKMIQLQRIIYELKSTSENYLFQKEFLNNFFNPRIDGAINTYREHIVNMQKVALEDYDFIIERTDRFYQRKYQNLLKSYSTEIDSLRSDSISAVTKLDQEKQSAIQASTQIKNQILAFESNSQKDISNFLQKFQSTVKKIETDGEIKLKTEISNLQLREQKFIKESEQKQKKMIDDHFLLLELIKSGYAPPKINIQTVKSKINEIKKCIYGYQSNLKSLREYGLQQISVNRNKINQLIKEIHLLMSKNQNEQNTFQKVYDYSIEEFNDTIRQLTKNFNLIKQSYEKEIEQKLAELNEIKIQFQRQLDELKNGFSRNNQDDELQIEILQKSLDEKLQSVLESFEAEKNKMIQKVDELQNQIDSMLKENETMIQELKLQLENLINAHKIEIEELQIFFNSEKAKTLKNYENELNEIKQKMSNLANEGSQSETDAKAAIDNLEKERENLIQLHSKQISEFDLNSSEIFNSIQKETSEKVDHLKNQIDSMLSSYEKSLANEIDNCISNNERKKNELLKNIQNQYDNEMSLIRDSGYSKIEYERLLKKFQDEHLRLVEQSKQMVPFVVSNDMFVNMTLVINDLEKELQDHIIMVSSRKRCLNFEWQQKYDQMSKKFENSQQKHQNSRARNQIIQSLKNQIAKAVRGKEETVLQLTEKFNETSAQSGIKIDKNNDLYDEDEEINQLKNQLNEIIQNSEHSIFVRNQNSEQKKRQISQEFSSQIRSINEQIRNVLELIQRQNSFYEEKMTELSGLLDINKSDYQKSYEKSVNFYLNVFDGMKRKFLETEHLLRTKLKEQNFQNSRNLDFYHSVEAEEHKKQAKALNEKEEENKEFLLNKQKIKDDLSKKINELVSKKDFYQRNPNETHFEVKDKIEKLEKHLKMVTNQLNIALQDLVEYKNMFITQEKKINQNFNGMPEIGTYKRKQNIDVI